MERWKDIPNYKGYQASNLGRIRTHNKTTYTKKHGIRHWKDRILCFKPSTTLNQRSKQGMGYRVDLWKDGKPHTLLVSRLVATTFLEDLIDTDMTVNHKNGDRLDNRVENLEWLTLKENIVHAFENDLQPTQQHVEIVNLSTGAKAKFRSLAEASRFFNRNKGFVSGLKNKEKYFFKCNNTKYEIFMP